MDQLVIPLPSTQENDYTYITSRQMETSVDLARTCTGATAFTTPSESFSTTLLSLTYVARARPNLNLWLQPHSFLVCFGSYLF